MRFQTASKENAREIAELIRNCYEQYRDKIIPPLYPDGEDLAQKAK